LRSSLPDVLFEAPLLRTPSFTDFMSVLDGTLKAPQLADPITLHHHPLRDFVYAGSRFLPGLSPD
jgi:hypothetical protein